jgi:hypothetical protein
MADPDKSTSRCPNCGAEPACADIGECFEDRDRRADVANAAATLQRKPVQPKSKRPAAKGAPLPIVDGAIWESITYPGQRRDPASVLPRLRNKLEKYALQAKQEKRQIRMRKRAEGRKGYEHNALAQGQARTNKKIVERAQRDGLSQRDTALNFGMSRTTVQKYWRSKR